MADSENCETAQQSVISSEQTSRKISSEVGQINNADSQSDVVTENTDEHEHEHERELQQSKVNGEENKDVDKPATNDEQVENAIGQDLHAEKFEPPMEEEPPEWLDDEIEEMERLNAEEEMKRIAAEKEVEEQQRLKAREWLRKAVGDDKADFHDGQWEAIHAVANKHKRVVVVQRTGWGKSSVYFIATRILREEQGRGPTLIISPLLALMRNQVDAAARLDIKSATLNSTNPKDWEQITVDILKGKVDVILLSPERLNSEGFKQTVLKPIASSLGMLVIDECHCISIWGHDFRPDYRRIRSAIQMIPEETPVLGTTATANERVLDDIKAALGEDVEIQRGSLLRKSLALYVIRMPDTASRLAWLAANLRNMPKTSGIIYTNTKHDADQLATWLVRNTEFKAVYAYYSGVKARRGVPGLDTQFCYDSDAYRKFLEKCLQDNRIKALVATTALGMGFDKPDLGFVIHFQCPDSIVTYYQQVGRAGRGIDLAIGVLMTGEEDEKIIKHMSENAFPSKAEVESILEATCCTSTDGLTLDDLMERINLRRGQIEKALKFLAAEDDYPPIRRMLKPSLDQRERWIRNPLDEDYNTNNERVQRKINQRTEEWEEMTRFVSTTDCLMQFIRKSLGDHSDNDLCGKCSSCITSEFTFDPPEQELMMKAIDYMKNADIDLFCRKQTPKGGFMVYKFLGWNIPKHFQARDGKIMSTLNDGGWGSMVAEDRVAGRFRDDLVTAMARLVKDRWRPNPMPTWCTCVPSLKRPDPVGDFTKRLAAKLGINFLYIVKKVRENKPQRQMNNRYHQCRNLDGAFKIQGKVQTGPCLLVDDFVDSTWTMTVVAGLLLKNRSGPVMPVALAKVNVGDY